MLKFSKVLYFGNIGGDNNAENRSFMGSKTFQNKNMILMFKKSNTDFPFPPHLFVLWLGK